MIHEIQTTEYVISQPNTIKQLLGLVETLTEEEIAIHIKFQKKEFLTFPSKLPNKLVVVYDDDEESTPTCFDDLATAKAYLSLITQDPYKIYVKIKKLIDENGVKLFFE